MERRTLRAFPAALWLMAAAFWVWAPAGLFASEPPRGVRERIAKRDLSLKEAIDAAAKKDPGILGFAVERNRTWLPGSTVRVAFRGGDVELRRAIADVARTWTQYANVTLDFGSGDKLREWTTGDTAYAAEVRIGFDQLGYWSLIGTDAIDPEIPASWPSLNLQSFDSARPADWKAVVLHEFGHALGFIHEHQHPNEPCAPEFRLADDKGYVQTRNEDREFVADDHQRRPGLYTWFSGPPNEWNKKMVDDNLLALDDRDEHAYVTSLKLDKHSIMLYAFPDWFYTKGKESRCYTVPATTLSMGDQAGAGECYPKAKGAIREVIDDRIEFLRRLLSSPKLSDASRIHYQKQLDAALAARARTAA